MTVGCCVVGCCYVSWVGYHGYIIMYKPILKFTEEKTPHGIVLHGTLTIHKAITIPQYEGGSVDKRKQCEQFIEAEITHNYVRLRGLDELMIARAKFASTAALCPDIIGILNEIDTLIKELQYPQFEKVGNAE